MGAIYCRGRRIYCTGLSRAFIPVGVVHWLPVLSDSKTYTGSVSIVYTVGNRHTTVRREQLCITINVGGRHRMGGSRLILSEADTYRGCQQSRYCREQSFDIYCRVHVAGTIPHMIVSVSYHIISYHYRIYRHILSGGGIYISGIGIYCQGAGIKCRKQAYTCRKQAYTVGNAGIYCREQAYTVGSRHILSGVGIYCREQAYTVRTESI